MKREAHDELQRWLSAEAADDAAAALAADDAEAALAALFASLPLAAPRSGFAGRVLVRAGLGRRRGLLARPWARLALGATLAAAGAAATLAPGLFRALLGALDPVALLTAGPRLVAAVGAGAAEVVALAVKLYDLASTVVAPLASPPVAASLLAALLIAAAALRLLHHLIAHDRSWSYVDAHG